MCLIKLMGMIKLINAMKTLFCENILLNRKIFFCSCADKNGRRKKKECGATGRNQIMVYFRKLLSRLYPKRQREILKCSDYDRLNQPKFEPHIC